MESKPVLSIQVLNRQLRAQLTKLQLQTPTQKVVAQLRNQITDKAKRKKTKATYEPKKQIYLHDTKTLDLFAMVTYHDGGGRLIKEFEQLTAIVATKECSEDKNVRGAINAAIELKSSLKFGKLFNSPRKLTTWKGVKTFVSQLIPILKNIDSEVRSAAVTLNPLWETQTANQRKEFSSASAIATRFLANLHETVKGAIQKAHDEKNSVPKKVSNCIQATFTLIQTGLKELNDLDTIKQEILDRTRLLGSLNQIQTVRLQLVSLTARKKATMQTLKPILEKLSEIQDCQEKERQLWNEISTHAKDPDQTQKVISVKGRNRSGSLGNQTTATTKEPEGRKRSGSLPPPRRK